MSVDRGNVRMKLFKQLFDHVLSDERLHHIRFSEFDAYDHDVDYLRQELEAETERVEKTLNCVAVVVESDGAMGAEHSLELVTLVPQHADKDMVEQTLSHAQHRVLNRMMDHG